MNGKTGFKNVVYDRTQSVSQHLYALLLMSRDRFQSQLRSLITLIYDIIRVIWPKKKKWLYTRLTSQLCIPSLTHILRCFLPREQN